MKLLAFERKYHLDGATCDTCAGSGLYAHPRRDSDPVCWNCRGLGRRISLAGRELFYAIAELLGAPVLERESRIPPKHLDHVFAKNIVEGMKVGNAHPDRRQPPRIVEFVSMANHSVLITFQDGTQERASAHDTFRREFTEQELRKVDTLMAGFVGKGAIEVCECGDPVLETFGVCTRGRACKSFHGRADAT